LTAGGAGDSVAAVSALDVRTSVAAHDEARTEARVDQAGEPRLARLESVRALAALGVVTGHIWGTHYHFGLAAYDGFVSRTIFGGGYGVFVFFALSGYLLYRPLADATLGGTRTVDLRRYALNRALRILPLYYVVVAVLLVVQEGGGHPGQWLRFATLTENVFRSTAVTVDGPIWSLIVEVHFYALLPFAAFALARLADRSIARAAVVLLIAGLAGAALRIYLLNHRHVADPRITYSLVTTSFFFVPGMLLALGRVAWDRRGDMQLPGLLGSADAWLLASLPVWALIFDDYSRTPLAAVASFFVVGAAALPLRPGPLIRLLDLRALALVGVASYSLYLWHLPIVDAIARHHTRALVPLALAGFALSLLAAAASYRLVEEPFLRLRRNWASSQ
jgi:peptidoglycan/LPS O-acetylase OafA/YrhL